MVVGSGWRELPSLGLGGLGGMRGERGSQGLTWTELKASEVGLDGRTGTRANLATGRLTEVCLASEGEWCRVQICGPIAVLASGEAVLLRGQTAD